MLRDQGSEVGNKKIIVSLEKKKNSICYLYHLKKSQENWLALSLKGGALGGAEM